MPDWHLGELLPGWQIDYTAGIAKKIAYCLLGKATNATNCTGMCINCGIRRPWYPPLAYRLASWKALLGLYDYLIKKLVMALDTLLFDGRI